MMEERLADLFTKMSNNFINETFIKNPVTVQKAFLDCITGYINVRIYV